MHQMLPCLGEAAREARSAASIRPIQVAVHVGRDTKAVLSFERGLTWPRNFDVFLDRYAEAVGVKPVQIWQRAMALYLAEAEISQNGAS